MTRLAHRLLADGIGAITLLLVVVAIVRLLSVEPTAFAGIAAFVVTFAVVGWILWRRLPGNPIGWCISLSALVTAVSYAGKAWATVGLERGDSDSLVALAATLDANSWIVAIPLGVALPLLLLPAGSLPSPRWRPLVGAVLVGIACGAVGVLTSPAALEPSAYRHLSSPLALPALSPLPQILGGAGLVTMFAGTIAGIVLLIRRFRRATGVERQQMRWVAVGGGCAIVGSVAGAVSGNGGVVGLLGSVGAAVGMGALPVCLGVAVLRYRLYDLGRVVSRTLSYAVVTGLLLAVYLALVTAASWVLPAESPFAVAASTLAAAALFQPLRRRVQSAVDHRFNRARYDADRTVDAFTRRLRDEVDLDAVRADLLQIVHGTLQPTAVGLWLRDGSPR
jgi:hypothetical protein